MTPFLMYTAGSDMPLEQAVIQVPAVLVNHFHIFASFGLVRFTAGESSDGGQHIGFRTALAMTPEAAKIAANLLLDMVSKMEAAAEAAKAP